MKLGRNKDGILFFRRPVGTNGDLVTWHIHSAGETILRERGVTEGQPIPTDLFSDLEMRGYLYKFNSSASGTAARGRAAEQPEPWDWAAANGIKKRSSRPAPTSRPGTSTEPTLPPAWRSSPAPAPAPSLGTRSGPRTSKTHATGRPTAEVVSDPAKQRLNKPVSAPEAPGISPAQQTPASQRPSKRSDQQN